MRVSCDGSHLPTRLMQMVLERPRLHTQEKKNWNKICVHFSFFVMVIFVYICGWKHTRYETWGERNKKKRMEMKAILKPRKRDGVMGSE